MCVDIGAHVGFVSLALSQLVCDGHVYAFEPSPTNWLHLQNNLALNACKNVTAIQVAMGEAPGTRQLFVHPAQSGANFIGEGIFPTADPRMISVMTDTLDNQQWERGRVSLVKIDVEGWKKRVLRGGPDFLLATNLWLLSNLMPTLLWRLGELLRVNFYYCFCRCLTEYL